MEIKENISFGKRLNLRNIYKQLTGKLQFWNYDNEKYNQN